MKRLMAVTLTVLMLFSFTACGGKVDETLPPDDTTDVVEPDVTEPDVTEPEETDPIETDPIETQPTDPTDVVTDPTETQPTEVITTTQSAVVTDPTAPAEDEAVVDTDGDAESKSENTPWLLIGIIGAVVLVGGGVALFLFLRKKK